MHRIDLNCDMGESFGAYRLGADEEIIRWVTSVNIACGFHAGDPNVMRRTVRLALEHGAAIGAHPGLPDLAGFGRRTMALEPDEAYALVVYQIGALEAFVRSEGGRLAHVKPHGALYNMAAVRPPLAEAVAEAVRRVNPELVLFGLAGSELIRAGERAGLRTASEVFADRSYEPDGTLTPRGLPGAVLTEEEAVAGQVIRMVKEGKVPTRDGTERSIRADTLCIHGDTPHADVHARRIREALEQAGISVQKLETP